MQVALAWRQKLSETYVMAVCEFWATFTAITKNVNLPQIVLTIG